jgi:hypothetical protein
MRVRRGTASKNTVRWMDEGYSMKIEAEMFEQF